MAFEILQGNDYIDKLSHKGNNDLSVTLSSSGCKPLNENVIEQNARTSLACAIIGVRPLANR